jgi:hypothetical protein
MEMPEKCGLCDLFHAESPMHCTVVKGHKTVGAPYGIPRPEWCPLVALPDHHGRLVDADAFKADYGMKDDCADCEKEMRGKVKACEYDRIYSKMDFCGWLDDAQTIVEKES